MRFKMRADYPNYRTYRKAFLKRLDGLDEDWGPGYIPPEVTYVEDDAEKEARVRYIDMPFLTGGQTEGEEYFAAVLAARKGDGKAKDLLEGKMATLRDNPPLDIHVSFVENEFVVPCVSNRYMSEELISHKGTMLLKLTRADYPVPDFCILNSRFAQLDKDDRRPHILTAVENLEKLTGSKLGDPHEPLIFRLCIKLSFQKSSSETLHASDTPGKKP